MADWQNAYMYTYIMRLYMPPGPQSRESQQVPKACARMNIYVYAYETCACTETYIFYVWIYIYAFAYNCSSVLHAGDA